MKKLFILCIIFLSFFSTSFFNVENTHAQTEFPSIEVGNNELLKPTPVGYLAQQETGFWSGVGRGIKTSVDFVWNSTAGVAGEYGYATRAANAVGEEIQAEINETINGFHTFFKEIFFNILYYIFVVPVSWLTAIVGQMFDMLITTLTPTSSEDWGIIKIQSSIEVAWKIIRDVASIIIIFSLLYLGIKTILDGQGFADKKTLISIIIAAILLNFSLIFTKDIAFHISNKIGNEIYNTAALAGKTEGKSPTEALMGMIGPQSLFNDNELTPAKLAGGSKDWGDVFMYAIQAGLLTFVLLTTIFIFMGLMFTLLIRFIVFVILMITSPLGIIAFTIPWLKSHGQTWWSELKKQTIFFPAFVFIMYIIFLIIGELGGAKALEKLSVDTTGVVDGAVAFFLNFALIIGFLITLLILPGKLSEGGSQLASKAANWGNKKIRGYAGRTAGAATFGAAAMAGRYTIGAGASKILSSNRLKTAAQNPRGFGGTAARALLRRADKAQDYSFDARATKAGGAFAAKYGLGTAAKGWKSTIEGKKKAYKDNMEKEKKLYGFGEMDEAQKVIHAQELEVKKADRDNKAKVVSEKRKELEDARKSGASDSVIKNISESISKEEKELGKLETEVGKHMQSGDSTYIAYLNKMRHSGLNVRKRMSRTQKLALQALEKDMSKEWKEKGKAKIPKEKKQNNTPTVTITSSSSGGTTTI